MNKQSVGQGIGKRRILKPLFLLYVLVLLLAFRPVAAHSEDAVLQLANAPAGPFILNAWTYPALLRTGAIHFSVSTLEAAGGKPVPTAAVFVQATPRDEHGHAVLATGLAVLEPTSQLHEVDLVIQTPGYYQVTVQAADASGRQGQATFEIEVVSATAYKVLIVVLSVQAGLFTLWLGKEGIRTWGLDRWIR